VGGLPEKKVYLGGMSILSILLSLEPGCHTSTQTGHPLFPLVCPDTVKTLGASQMQTNMIAFSVKYSC
jgi:hypothetical protein